MKDVDPFPNAPGLSRELNLKESSGKPPEKPGYWWASVCSKHQEWDKDCKACSVGSYVKE